MKKVIIQLKWIDGEKKPHDFTVLEQPGKTAVMLVKQYENSSTPKFINEEDSPKYGIEVDAPKKAATKEIPKKEATTTATKKAKNPIKTKAELDAEKKAASKLING